MNDAEKHVEIISDEITDESLIEYYKREFKDGMLYDTPEFREVLKNLGYKFNSGKIITKDGNEATIKTFLDDLQLKFNEDDTFKIKIGVCEHLEKYIDFSKTNIDVLAPIDTYYLSTGKDTFFSKLENCHRTILINQEMITANYIDWINEEGVEFAFEDGEILDIEPEEMIRRHHMLREYMLSESHNLGFADRVEYNYFIKNKSIESDIDNIKRIERWLERKGYEKQNITIQLSGSKGYRDSKLAELLETREYTGVLEVRRCNNIRLFRKNIKT